MIRSNYDAATGVWLVAVSCTLAGSDRDECLEALKRLTAPTNPEGAWT